jgi:iron complex outermembrane receptor protein
MRKFILLFAVLTVLPLKSVELTDTTIIRLKQVEVEAARKKQFPEIGRVVRRIDSAQLQVQPALTTEALLRFVPGVDVRQRGAGGTQADLSLRGGSFDQVLVLLNGIDITDPQTGHHHMNLPVDIADLTGVEVLQGAASRRYGSGAFSGAINFATRASKNRQVSAEASYGSYNTYRLRAAANLSSGEFSNFTSLTYTASDGYRHNTDYNRMNLYSLTSWQNEKAGITELQLGLQHKSFGANGFYTLAYPEQYEHTRTLFSSLRWKKQWDDLDLTVQAHSRRHYDRFELFRDFSGAASWYQDHNYHLTDVNGASASLQYFSNIGKISAGLSFRNDHVYSTVLGHPIPDSEEKPANVFEKDAAKVFTREANRFISNAFVDYTGNWNNFVLTGGISLGSSIDYGPQLNFGTELSYFVQNELSFFVSANTATRLPTFTDLFYQNATHTANPGLQPEKSLNIEGGIAYNEQRFSARASVFARRGTNIIDWVKYAGETKWSSLNLVEVNTAGAEFSVEYKPESNIINHLQMSYTFIQNDKIAEGFDSKYALDYLRHQFLLGIDHRIMNRLSASWNVSMNDRAGNYSDFNTGIITDYNPFWLVNTRLRYDLKNWQLFADVNNVLNVSYVDFGGLPLPGIHFQAGFRWNLK